MTDAEHYARSAVDHPAGRSALGSHRAPTRFPESEMTPADVLEHNRAWQVAQGIMFGIGALGVVLLVLVVAVTVFRVVIGPW